MDLRFQKKLMKQTTDRLGTATIDFGQARLSQWRPLTASAALCSAKSRQGCGLASLIYVQSYLSVKISYEIRNASSKGILPHCELAVIMQNSNSETTKTRKKGPKLICIKLQIKHLL